MTTKSSANDIQHGGTHYRTEYQHWDLLPDMHYSEEYYLGCATKYVTRYKKKNGIEDLRKAHHFISKLIELIAAGRVRMPAAPHYTAAFAMDMKLEQFMHFNEQDEDQRYVLRSLFTATSASGLEAARDRLERMINNIDVEVSPRKE